MKTTALLFLMLVPLFSTCTAPNGEVPSPTIECGIVAPEEQATAREVSGFSYWNKAKGEESLTLEVPLKRFDLERAFLTVDHRGEKAVGFEIVPEQQSSFSQFTKEHIGRQMACLVDGRIVTSPTIEDVLPGSGIVTGNLSDEEWDEVLTLLSPDRH